MDQDHDFDNDDYYISGDLAYRINKIKEVTSCRTYAEASKVLSNILDEVINFEKIEQDHTEELIDEHTPSPPGR